jgi:hypothetical protein
VADGATHQRVAIKGQNQLNRARIAAMAMAMEVVVDDQCHRLLQEALTIESVITVIRKDTFNQNVERSAMIRTIALIKRQLHLLHLICSTYLCDPFKIPLAHAYTDMDRIGLEQHNS